MAAKKGTYVGFKKLSGQLAKKGVDNPDAVAASIGRNKYGNAGMAKKSAAGRARASRKK